MLRAICLITGVAVWPAVAQQGPEFFESKIRPVLAANCYGCHSAKLKVSGLDLSSAAGFSKGGERGALVDGTNPEKSPLLAAIGYTGGLKMPPAGKLKAEEIENIATWVKTGAVWPGGSVSPSQCRPPHPNTGSRKRRRSSGRSSRFETPRLPR